MLHILLSYIVLPSYRAMKTIPPSHIGAVFLALSSLIGTMPATAQDNGNTPVNFTFASWIGTGLYRASGREVVILRMPFAIQLRDPDPEWTFQGFGAETWQENLRPDAWGLRLRLPVTIGSSSFSDLPDNFETVTFVPGLEAQIPIRKHWTIKSFAHLGVGKDFSSGDFATIYGAGVSSGYRIPLQTYTVTLGAKALAAGSKVSGGDSSGFTKFDLGVDVGRPLNVTIGERRLHLNLFYITSFFGDNLNLLREENFRLESVQQLHQVGIAIGAVPRYRIGRLRIPRLGLSYIQGDNLEGIRITGEFPF